MEAPARLLAAAIFAILATTVAAQAPQPLEGLWLVDLSTDPAKPYTKMMELKLATDGTVTGTFYESKIQAGRWKTDRERTCVSFRTSDGAGPYHSSACLRGSIVEGQTWAEQRSFLFNWNATRAK